MAALLRLGWTAGNVRTIDLAGEALPLRLADDLFKANPDLALFNLYGPTKTTVYSTYSAFRTRTGDRPRSPSHYVIRKSMYWARKVDCCPRERRENFT